jgi:hypothetical protein
LIAVFIYSCPLSSKIKAKMLYSSVKAAATGNAEDCGVKIEKKVSGFSVECWIDSNAPAD